MEGDRINSTLQNFTPVDPEPKQPPYTQIDQLDQLINQIDAMNITGAKVILFSSSSTPDKYPPTITFSKPDILAMLPGGIDTKEHNRCIFLSKQYRGYKIQFLQQIND